MTKNTKIKYNIKFNYNIKEKTRVEAKLLEENPYSS